jgi:hypothetical protein
MTRKLPIFMDTSASTLNVKKAKRYQINSLAVSFGIYCAPFTENEGQGKFFCQTIW